jgi:hypothetical protein
VLGVVAAVIAAAAWYHSTRPAAIVDTRPRHPELVSFSAGTFRGVSLGERTAAVVRALGEPGRRGSFPSPTTGPPDAGLPGGPGATINLDYADMAVAMRGGRVVWIVITAPAAQTRLGAGIGDSLVVWRRAFPRLRCVAHSEPSDPPSGAPACFEHLRPGVNVEIVGDPVTVIAVHGTAPRTHL